MITRRVLLLALLLLGAASAPRAAAEPSSLTSLPDGWFNPDSTGRAREGVASLALDFPDHRRILQRVRRDERELSYLLPDGSEGRRVRVLIDRFIAADGLEGVLVALPGSKRAHGFFRSKSPDAKASDANSTTVETFFSLTPDGTEADSAVLHRVSRLDSLPSQVAECGSDSLGAGGRARQEQGDLTVPRSGEWREITLLAVLSGDFSGARGDAQLVVETAAVIEAANLFFNPLQLSLRLVGVQVIRPGASDPYRLASEAQDSRAMLETVRRQWRLRTAPKRDVTALLSRSAYAGIFGLAYPSVSCLHPDFSYLFATEGGFAAAGVVGLGATVAHELGHILGISHDRQPGPLGPSLMWPSFISNPAGFSEASLLEFDQAVVQGAIACLAETPPPPIVAAQPGGGSLGPSSAFDGGAAQSIRVREGELLTRYLGLVGAPAGARYRAEGLPVDALFDVDRAVLSYRPGYAAAGPDAREVEIPFTVTAAIGEAVLRASHVLVVEDRNRAPEILLNRPLPLAAAPLEQFELLVTARDPDAGDSPRLHFNPRDSFHRIARGATYDTAGGSAAVRWTPPPGAAGTLALELFASDGSGGHAVRTVEITLGPANGGPVIDAPDEVTFLPGAAVRFDARVSDPEGTPLTVDVLGLPAGAIIEHRAESLAIGFTSSGLPDEQYLVTIVSSDGQKRAEKQIKVYASADAAGSAAVSPLRWPGAPRPHLVGDDFDGDGISEAALYDPATGRWAHYPCSGGEAASAQFGGFFGDVPLVLRRGDAAVRGIYRVVLGQGYWFVDEVSATSIIAWGLAGDIPVAGDFDGDGISDQAVYRPGTKEWHIRFTAMPPQVLRDTMLGPESRPAVAALAADIDGDGRDDRVLFSRKTDGSLVFHATLADGRRFDFAAGKAAVADGALPILADLDSDGRSDVGTWIPSSVSLLMSASERIERRTVSANDGLLFGIRRCQGVDEVLVGGRTAAVLGAPERTFDVEGPRLRTPYYLASQVSLSKSKAAAGDISGDGVADFAVWRSRDAGDAGSWLEQQALLRDLRFETLYYRVLDVVSGDFFGTRQQVPTVFVDGLWLHSELGAPTASREWGLAGDVPVPGDYNGDGITERAIFRAEGSQWWILFDDGHNPPDARVARWGAPGDVPVPADYDGDGTDDIAVWRETTGDWFILYADGRVEVERFGSTGDIPLPGRYTGAAAADLVFWRPANGTWYLKQAGAGAAGVTAVQWGLPGDVPVRADFDGDRRLELSVWRPSNGTWYVRRLDSLFAEASAVQFGLPGDLPIGGTGDLRVR